MADSIYEMLLPSISDHQSLGNLTSLTTSNYLNRLSTLTIASLTGSEQEALEHEASSVLRSIQALTKRSYKSINSSVQSLESLQESLPKIVENANTLKVSIPRLDHASSAFAEKYSQAAENPLLERRKKAMTLGENVDRLSDVLELPTLLSSTVSASTGTAAASVSSTTSSATASYTSALDLYMHVKRLQRLYPQSRIVKSIFSQAEEAMRDMATNIISSLRAQSLKLAGGMRLIGLLRRISPELDEPSHETEPGASAAGGSSEGSLGALFLVCRLANLISTVEALDPLKNLADQDTEERMKQQTPIDERNAWAAGQHTERYLKRYIEVFREQCFAMVSIYKSIFPGSLPGPSSTEREASGEEGMPGNGPNDELQVLPAALATFSWHIADLLTGTLEEYLPNIRERASRDSLLTQVLYCSASLGRLGGDFGMILSLFEESSGDIISVENGVGKKVPEWVHIVNKHRVQAGRLELLASGVGTRAAGSSR